MKTIHLLSCRLHSLRSRFGLTQEEFAERTGFDYKFYQAIESGRKKQLWVETLERLADAYGIEPWELIAPEDPVRAGVPQLAKPRAGDENKPVRPIGRPKGAKKNPDKSPHSPRLLKYRAEASEGGMVAESGPTKRRGPGSESKRGK